MATPTFVRATGRNGVGSLIGPSPWTFFSGFQVDGANRLLVVATSKASAADTSISSIRWNGTEEFTRLEMTYQYSTSGRFIVWYLVNPTATTADLVMTHTMAAAGHFSALVLLFAGVDQANPFGGAPVKAWSTLTDQQVTVPGAAADDLALAIASQYSGAWDAPGDGQTILHRENANIRLSATSKVASGAETLMVDGIVSGTVALGMIGVAIKGATTGEGTEVDLGTGALAGSGSAGGSLALEVSIEGAHEAAGTLSGILGAEISLALAGAAGSGALAGTLTVEVALLAPLAGAGILGAVPAAEIALLAALAGSGDLAGVLNTWGAVPALRGALRDLRLRGRLTDLRPRGTIRAICPPLVP